MRRPAGIKVESNPMSTDIETPTALLPGEMEVASLIVSALSLETRPEDIPPDEPLFGAGLGLDSIDALELALAISKAYGVQLRSDDERNHRIFSSLRTLSAHIEKHRAR
jgi:acyl carrier protein